MTLSIDIGLSHMAYSLFDDNMTLVDFGFMESDLRNKGILERVNVVKAFLRIFDIKRLIIEKQTPFNPVCFALMYCFPAAFDGKVIVTDPKTKFEVFKAGMNTKNKQHKKDSIELVKQCLSEEHVKKLEEFEKKDDIADSILQAMAITIVESERKKRKK
jgi:hypothetical protein